MSSNITKAHFPECEGETAPSFSTIGAIRLEVRCANERESSSTRRDKDGAAIDPASGIASQ